MTITEKTAYLKGLMEGLKIGKEDDMGKLVSAIVETLDEMALAIDDIDAHMDEVDAEIEDIEDTIEDIEDAIDDIDDDIDDICDAIDEIYDDDDEDDDDYDWDDDELYELECPTCGEHIVIDEVQLGGGEMKCPACGEDLEFDLSSLVEDDGEEDEE